MDFSEIAGSMLAMFFLFAVALACFSLNPKHAPKAGILVFVFLAVRAGQQYCVNYIFFTGCILLTVFSLYVAYRGMNREKKCTWCRP